MGQDEGFHLATMSQRDDNDTGPNCWKTAVHVMSMEGSKEGGEIQALIVEILSIK